MFGFLKCRLGDARATLSALDRSLAIIEFDLAGRILTANENFCKALGYRLDEIQGRHHSIFVDPDYAGSREYTAFWDKLRRGEFDARDYVRIGKGGKEVFIQASYNPVRNFFGKPYKVVKVAAVTTDEAVRIADFRGKMDAVSRVQAMIEFTPDGEVLNANDAFLSSMGYGLDEIRGQHHRLFVEKDFARSPDYAALWRKLQAGEYVAAEFKRIGRNGRIVWLQASYNPIFDHRGRVTKVVKFATDVTSRVQAVDEVAGGLDKLARNALSHRLVTPIDPAYEKLRRDFNAAMETLETTMGAISASAGSVGSGAQEIASASNDLARRTEMQAANLEQTATTLGEITRAVTRSAAGARAASISASVVRADAVKSGEVVREAVVAMGEIKGSSQEIGQIIGMIDQIAFQTNMLALNAGVEAARAGDAGRGFAVVASEVRTLAQRSAEAASKIKALIGRSGSEVARGAKLVEETGMVLNAVVKKISEIDALVSEIAQTTEEQAIGLTQVNEAVTQLDQVTQQNAAMVEEATAAATSLSHESHELMRLISQFETCDRPQVLKTLSPVMASRSAA
ncbi:methyl-accepting chemotaxis protein [Gluconacetobacter sp. Hr-1-5]|uniref:methyl-accepting chemotaxis protein n=1 Tax=Gluconacetobacter sp. Hr-1-5 TaxID=3395370 RepID=UPI003B51A661